MSEHLKPHSKSKDQAAEIDRLEQVIYNVQGLTSALQIVSGGLCESRIQDARLAKLRNAVIGLSAAFDAATGEALG